MPDALGDDRWDAIRALIEGALPTHERVACAAGIYVKSISRRSRREGWEKLDLRRPRVRAAHVTMIRLAGYARAGDPLDPVAWIAPEGDGEGPRVPAVVAGPDEPGANVMRVVVEKSGEGAQDKVRARAGRENADLRDDDPEDADLVDDRLDDPDLEDVGSLGRPDGFGRVMRPREPDPLPDLPPVARIARIGAILTRRTEAMLARAEIGQPIESRQVTALSALVQLSERIAALAREGAGAEARARDDRMRPVLRKIDWRIRYLAREEARRQLIDVFGIAEDAVDAALPAIAETEGAG